MLIRKRMVGTLKAVSDSSGNVLLKREYDSFGNILSEVSTLPFEMPFGFAGGLHDKDTGLVRFGHRDYDPEIGRWTAKDPIGFAGGDTDLYGYCLNDPVNSFDPWGLAEDQHGMGPLSSNDGHVEEAVDKARKEGVEAAEDYLDDVIRDMEDEADKACGKKKKKLLKRLEHLRGALKVLPRYFIKFPIIIIIDPNTGMPVGWSIIFGGNPPDA
ncbi:RHS repeat domain-containing protein [Desulfonema magnum]|uniref:RHS repeat-associated core domain-containing protein n=1 Tax=Desulfonema magnum TaxID=45655 RepID=A0A975BEZ3_9BACT|nr:RHS repeat-associated core domain-containing protein [Desulfonema magnum]QTA84141.1 RHS repeat-associated core domain-containing protein [Desulfonema magnum]